MRRLTLLLLSCVAAPLAGCGDDAPAADAADPGFLYQALGLGDAPTGPNGLGELAPSGGGIGAPAGAGAGLGQAGEGPGLGQAPGAPAPGAGGPGCAEVCARLVECELDDGSMCLSECNGIRAQIGEALAQQVLECVLTQRCNRISRCIEDAVDGPEDTPSAVGEPIPSNTASATDSAP